MRRNMCAIGVVVEYPTERIAFADFAVVAVAALDREGRMLTVESQELALLTADRDIEFPLGLKFGPQRFATVLEKWQAIGQLVATVGGIDPNFRCITNTVRARDGLIRWRKRGFGFEPLPNGDFLVGGKNEDFLFEVEAARDVVGEGVQDAWMESLTSTQRVAVRDQCGRNQIIARAMVMAYLGLPQVAAAA